MKKHNRFYKDPKEQGEGKGEEAGTVKQEEGAVAESTTESAAGGESAAE